METMTPKERIDAVIKHQAVDRPPFTVVDGGAWIAKTEGVTYRELYSRPDSGASSVVDYLNKIDSDMISAVSGVFTACLNAFGCPISIDKIGGAIDTGSVFKDPIMIQYKGNKNIIAINSATMSRRRNRVLCLLKIRLMLSPPFQ